MPAVLAGPGGSRSSLPHAPARCTGAGAGARAAGDGAGASAGVGAGGGDGAGAGAMAGRQSRQNAPRARRSSGVALPKTFPTRSYGASIAGRQSSVASSCFQSGTKARGGALPSSQSHACLAQPSGGTGIAVKDRATPCRERTSMSNVRCALAFESGMRPTREGDGSLIDARLVALASINLGGSLLPLQMGKRVSERATRGGEGRNTAVVSGHRIHVVRLGKPSEPVRTRRLRSLGARVLGGSSAW